jgi:hypothetical protein
MFLTDWYKKFMFRCHMDDINDMMDLSERHRQIAEEHLAKATKAADRVVVMLEKVKNRGY